MPSQDILVVVDEAGSEGDAGRATIPAVMAASLALAARLGARLTGLFATGNPITPVYGDMAGWMSLIDAYRTTRGNASARAEAEFRRALARHAVAGDWISREDDPTAGAVDVGRLFDLVVVAQPDPDAGSRAVPAPRPAEIVLAAGRPVLVIPYAGNFPEIGRRVMVAWNGSREATRALHDAMFVLDRADQVTVVAVDPAPADRAPSAAEVAELLVRRGIGAKAETAASGDVAVADLLVSRAADLAADLVVMGAYGHSRLREYVLGGVSRSVLGQMTLPVLLAH